MLALYPLFVFDISYNLGRQFGKFLIFPPAFNTLLQMHEGNSINALQTKLFIKRCLYDEFIQEKTNTPNEPITETFIFKQVFNKSTQRLKKIKKFFDTKHLKDEKKI